MNYETREKWTENWLQVFSLGMVKEFTFVADALLLWSAILLLSSD